MIILSNHGILQSQQATISSESILLGGLFVNYGADTKRYFTSINLDGSVDNTFDPGYSFGLAGWSTQANDGTCIREDSSGNLYVGGIFTTYKGTTVNRIMKIFTNGSIDTSFNTGTGFDGTISSMAIDSAGKIYVGGEFTNYQGVAANYIIKLNTDGTKDTSFDNSTGFNNAVYSVALDSAGKIYVGGTFTSYKGTTANRIIKLNTNGTKDTSFDNSTGFSTNQVTTIKINSSGNLMVLGTFTNYKGATTNGIVRLLTTGAIDTTFNSGVGVGFTVGAPSNLVFDSSGKMYVIGTFTTYNGVLAQNRIIKLNTDGTKDTSFNFGTGFSSTATGIVMDSAGKLYVSGQFASYNGITCNYGISLNTDGTQNTTFDLLGTGLYTGFTSFANLLFLSSSNKIYALGIFTSYQGQNCGIISLNTTGSKNTAFNNYKGFIRTPIAAGSSGQIIASVKDSAGNIYVGGNFTSYNGVSYNSIVKLFPNGSVDTSFNSGSGFAGTRIINTIVIDPSTGKIYVGGTFSSYNGSTAQNIIRLNTDGQRDPTFDTTTGSNSTVNTIALDSSGNLYVGGSFTTYKSTNATYIVKLFSDASIDTSFAIAGTTFNQAVNKIVLDSAGKLYVGGLFTAYRGATNNRIIKLNTNNTKDTSFDNTTGFINTVQTIVLDSAGKLYVGGNFTTYKSVTANRIIKLNTDGTKDTSFVIGTGFNGICYSILIDATGSMYVGGEFQTWKDVFYGGIIKLLPTGSVDTSFTTTSAGFNTQTNSGPVRSIIKLT